MRPPLLILVVVLVLLGGVAALFLAIRPGGSSAELATPLGPGSGEAIEDGASKPGELAGPGRSMGGARDQVAGGDARPEGAPTEEGPITLRGRAILVDELGRELGEEDGRFTLWPFTEGYAEGLSVEVRGGEWEVSFERCAELGVTDLVLGGRGAGLPTDGIPLPTDLYLVLRGQVLREVLLHVLAAEDGADLSGVEIVPGDVRWESRYPPPELQGVPPVVSGATSPVAFAPPASSETGGKHGYYVRAADHAWAPIEIDHTAGGNREVRLVPAGDLEIEVVGKLPRPEIELRLFAAEGELLWRSARIQELTRLESVPVGEHRVALELGNYQTDRLVFGEGTAEILAGRTTQLTVTPTQLDPPARDVTVAGLVHVPPGWPEVEAALALKFTPLRSTRSWGAKGQRLAHARLQAGTSGTFAFETRLPLAGSWEVVIEPVGYRERIEVGPGGVRDLSFELPPLARVTVQVVAAEDRSPVPVRGLNWGPAKGGEYTYVEVLPAPPATPGTVSFVAPAGEVVLAVWPDGDYRMKTHPATLRPGENRIRVELDRLCGFRITFRDGEATVPFDQNTRYLARDVEGEKVELSWDSAGSVWFPAPGTYTLSIIDFAGFEPVEGFEVTLEGWAMTPVELHLIRLR